MAPPSSDVVSSKRKRQTRDESPAQQARKLSTAAAHGHSAGPRLLANCSDSAAMSTQTEAEGSLGRGKRVRRPVNYKVPSPTDSDQDSDSCEEFKLDRHHHESEGSHTSSGVASLRGSAGREICAQPSHATAGYGLPTYYEAMQGSQDLHRTTVGELRMQLDVANARLEMQRQEYAAKDERIRTLQAEVVDLQTVVATLKDQTSELATVKKQLGMVENEMEKYRCIVATAKRATKRDVTWRGFGKRMDELLEALEDAETDLS